MYVFALNLNPQKINREIIQMYKISLKKMKYRKVSERIVIECCRLVHFYNLSEFCGMKMVQLLLFDQSNLSYCSFLVGLYEYHRLLFFWWFVGFRQVALFLLVCRSCIGCYFLGGCMSWIACFCLLFFLESLPSSLLSLPTN